jgi:hypothetical protein
VSALRKAVAAVLTVALAALAMWLYTLKPHLESRLQEPLATSGRIGAAVRVPDFTVKVDKVDVAGALTKPAVFGSPTVMRSPGWFVIVHAQVQGNKKPILPGHIRLVTRGGLAYDESGRTAIFSSYGSAQPLLWTPVTYIFEIPKDRLAGVRLVVGTTALLDQLSGEASIDLGVDGARAARLAAHPPAAYVLKNS